MPEIDVESTELKKAIESQHGGIATLVQSVPVLESFGGKLVWEGSVHVFDLSNHPSANRAYAWSEPIESSNNRRFFAVLHVPPVDSPVKAVRASIVHRQQQK